MRLLTRRQVLTAIAQLATTASLAGCGINSSDTALSEAAGDREVLASIAYELFPHQSLSPELYLNVADNVLALNDAVVDDGLIQVRSQLSAERNWLALSETEKINILTAMQNSAFFTLMRTNTVAVLYQQPEVFEMVGYGGSAVEFGGYVNRGFDDISWLPEQGADK